MKSRNLLKPELLILLSLCLSPHSFAQTLSEAGSGAGNGDLNRNVLQYKASLTEAQLQVESMDEAMQEIKKKIQSFTEMVEPVPSATIAPFWTELSDNGRMVIKNYDQSLIEKLSRANQTFETLHTEIRKSLALISTLESERALYGARNLDSNLEKVIGEARAGLKGTVDGRLFEIFQELMGFRVLFEYSVEQKSNLSPFIDQCDTAPCFDQIQNKSKLYFEFISQLSNMPFTLFNDQDRLFNFWEKSLFMKGDSQKVGKLKFCVDYYHANRVSPSELTTIFSNRNNVQIGNKMTAQNVLWLMTHDSK